MPDPDDRHDNLAGTRQPRTHPVLEAMAEAVGVISDAAAYLSPTREFDEPSLEEATGRGTWMAPKHWAWWGIWPMSRMAPAAAFPVSAASTQSRTRRNPSST